MPSPIVLETAVPERAAMPAAAIGCRRRVETTVAMALAASVAPLMASKPGMRMRVETRKPKLSVTFLLAPGEQGVPLAL
jgi:hypothetical protein